VSTIVWQRSGLTWEDICRRAGARRRWNALRTFLANERRCQVLELLLELGGLQWGVQAEIARRLQVHPSVISKDINHHLMPLARPCERCGTLQTREWWREA
jgi:hypothetical protein